MIKVDYLKRKLRKYSKAEQYKEQDDLMKNAMIKMIGLESLLRST